MRAALLLVGAFGLVGCKDKGDDSGETDDGTFTDTDIAEAVWSEIQGYASWSQVDGWVGVQPSADGTHGDYVQIWLNDEAYDTITAAAGVDLPTGAVIVKEGYATDGAAASTVTVTKKFSGYDPDHHDWFWARFDPDGTVRDAGKLSSCYGCHEAGQDYVMFTTW